MNLTLPQASQRVLEEGGRLSTAIPNFSSRAAQVELGIAIAQTIEENTTLVAEVGTGTGKTYAYLVPALLSKKKILISTATKTLQDQLFHKDLPLLIRALGLTARAQNLKGRANYLCQYRTELHMQESSFASVQCAEEIRYVHEKWPQLETGERSALPEIAEDSPVWPYVTSTADNCLGSECPHYDTCFLVKARKQALEAEILVINHHLYFADSQLKEESFAELLPVFEVVIFDEAHQLADIATYFYSEQVGTRQFRELFNDMLREWPLLDLANQPLKQLSMRLDQSIEQMGMGLRTEEDRLEWSRATHNQNFIAAWSAFSEVASAALACFSDFSVADYPGLARCKERLLSLTQLITSLEKSKSAKQDAIYWIEKFKQHLVFHKTPYAFTAALQAVLSRENCSYIFTSATLTMVDSFDYFLNPLGISPRYKLRLASPFDYQQQALLYLPRGLPDPKDSNYYELLLVRALPVMKAFRGRCFFLFTSHRALQKVAGLLADQLDYPILVQGEEAKSILLARFRELGNAVLLGTASFWEGVDVKGEALSCVIIDKLPFTSPADPVTRGKMAHLKSQGLSAFDELSLPQAVLALKQGVGRLIRDMDDRGVLMIADPRLVGREYGRRIFDSLPRMRKTRDEEAVLTFIKTLALS